MTRRILSTVSASLAMLSTRPHVPKHASWPYKPVDFERYDTSPDDQFYAYPRLVTHIDDNAIACLRAYYATVLPKQGRVLDLCSSWISHYPEDCTADTGLTVLGLGMNKHELDSNPILSERILQDLNANPTIPSIGPLEAATCVVSIDYLTRPREVLESLRTRMSPGAKVHLTVSNRCFPTKAIRRWLNISEEQRLEMVGDYLHFAEWKDVEIVELCDGTAKLTKEEAVAIGRKEGEKYRVDPLWVVRGTA